MVHAGRQTAVQDEGREGLIGPEHRVGTARAERGSAPPGSARMPGFALLLSLPATAMGLALSVQISVLSWILATRYGLAIEEIGLVWAAGPLAGIVGQLLIGALSDRVWLLGGRRRPFILMGGVAAAVSLLLLPRIGEISGALGLASVMAVAVTVALTLDLAVNVGFNPARSLIADLTQEGGERTRSFSIMQVVSGSFGVGAYALAAAFGNDALIHVAAGLVLVFTLLPAILITEPRELGAPLAVGDPAPTLTLVRLALAISPLWALLVYDLYGFALHLLGIATWGYAAELLCAGASVLLILHAFTRPGGADGTFRQIIAASALTWLGVQPIFVFMVSFLQGRMPALGAEALGQVTSLAFLAMNAVAALAPLGLGWLARTYDPVRVHVAALGLMALGCAGIWLAAAEPWQLYGLMALCGIGWGAIVSLPFSIMSGHVESARMGLFMGLFNLSIVLPQLLSSLGISRVVAAAPDKGLIFALSGGFLLLSALAWFPLRSPQPKVPR